MRQTLFVFSFYDICLTNKYNFPSLKYLLFCIGTCYIYVGVGESTIAIPVLRI